MKAQTNVQRIEEMYANTRLPSAPIDQVAESALAHVLRAREIYLVKYGKAKADQWPDVPDVTEIRRFLLNKDLTLEDISRVTAEDIAATMPAYQRRVISHTSAGRARPRWPVWLLGDVLVSHKAEAWKRAKEAEAKDAKGNVLAKKIALATRSIDEADAMRAGWDSFSDTEKRKRIEEHKAGLPDRRLGGEVTARAAWWRNLSDEEKAKWKGAKR